MSLPFLKTPRKQTGISMQYRKPDEKAEQSQEADSLEVCADEMLKAHSIGDKKALAQALRAAFAILESEPHMEGPHLESEGE